MAVKSLSLLAALLLTVGAAEATPKIQHWQTSNGARVYFVPAPELPIVDVQVVFDGGGAREPEAKAGVALLTNALLDDGAGDLDADQIAQRFEGVGAQFGTSSHRDMAVLSLRSLTDPALLRPALDTFKLVLARPTFPEPAFQRERNQLLIAVQGRRQSPAEIADELFYRSIYGEHPYAHPPGGTEESLKGLQRDDLLTHHKQYYVARNAVVALVGALDRKAAEQLVEELLAGVPKGQAAVRLPAPPVLKEGRVIRRDFPSSQSHIIIGQPGMTRDDPEYFPLYVGNHALGGSGLVSRLNDEIREKRGLSYSVYSYFTPMRVEGPYTIGLQTKNASAEEALKVVRETVAGFAAQGPTKEELQASKQNITGGFPLRIASNSKILGYVAAIGFYGLPLDYLETFNSKVEAVSLDGIRDAFKRRVYPERMATVIVGGKP